MTASRRLRALRWAVRHVEKPLLARAKHPFWTRVRTEVTGRAFLRGRAPFRYRSETIAGVPTRTLPGGEGTLFYIHGGAYILMSARTHQGIAARLASSLDLTAVLPDYGRAPEHPFPEPLNQVEAVYRDIAQRPGPLVIAGDSAGGGLAMALLRRILAGGMRVPDAVLAFSPWVDMTLSGASIRENAERDPFLPASAMPYVRGLILGAADPAEVDASPVFGDYPGAPPVLIQAIEDEILLSDAQMMAARLESCHAPVELQVLPYGIHAFQLFHGLIPEADDAVDRALAFAAKALADR